MTTGTLLFVHLIPRIPRGELKSIFFFTNIFWTHETDFANCLYSNASPEFNFFFQTSLCPLGFQKQR